jgi:reactive intermediate/imine deaminase
MKTISTLSLLTLSLAIAACQPGDGNKGETEVEHLNLPGIEGSGMPFSSAARAGDMLYLSGVIGVIPGTLQVPDTIEEEARLAMEEIKSTVEAFGSSMDRVVKCTVFMADESYRDAFNAVYMGYFDKLPARSGVTVKGLALGAKAEVECIAVVG